MAKIYGLNGLIKGRQGNNVFSVRNGAQVVSAYNPAPANPSTSAQVAARARFKLMSQISEVLARASTMPRIGNVSSRNRFFAKNYPLTSYDGDKASILMTSVQLTDSVLGLPGVQITRGGQYNQTVQLAASVDLNVDAIVYTFLTLGSDNVLRYAGSALIREAGESNAYPVTVSYGAGVIYVYAYGMTDDGTEGIFRYLDLEVDPATAIATLIAQGNMNAKNVRYTETRANRLAAYTSGE